MSVHYTNYDASSSGNTDASRLYGAIFSGDNTPGTNIANSITVNGVDTLVANQPGYIDSGAAGAPWVCWFNLANPSAGIPVTTYDIVLAANNSVCILFEPA